MPPGHEETVKDEINHGAAFGISYAMPGHHPSST
jgi:hypothetical protein